MNIKLFKQSLSTQIDLKTNNWKSELLMEAFLIENYEILKINDSSKVTVIDTQIHLDKGRISLDRNGRLDMLIAIENESSSDENSLAIVELKKGTLDKENLNQLNDYLKSFQNLKNELLTGEREKYKNYTLKGFLIGTNIDIDVKEYLISDTKGSDDSCEIIGITLNRFLSVSTNESFVISETYSNKKSAYKRFESLEEFLENKKIKKSEIIKILKNIIEVYQDQKSININYTPTDISINSLNSSSKRKCFAYVRPQSKSVKVYIKLNSKVETHGITLFNELKNKELMPNSFYFDIESDNIQSEVIELIEKSKLFIES